MDKPIIAVDIDGVLADWVGWAVPKLNKILGTSLKANTHVNFDLHKSFGVSSKAMREALDELYKNFSISDCPTIENSQKSILELSKKFDIIAITARPKNLWTKTYNWTKNNFDNLIEVYLGTAQGKVFGGGLHLDNKLALCERFNAKYLIEDNPAEILEALKSKTTPLCHARPWNIELENNPKIPRGNWKFLRRFILEREK